MTKKIFIGYSTWSGSTHEVADAIASHLMKSGFQVDIFNFKKVNILSDSNYDAFILGTSFHASHPGGAFLNFVKNNYALLSEKPTAIFTVCANMFQDTPENRSETLTWLQDSLKDVPEIPFLDIGLFGGAVITSGSDYEKLNPIVKMIIKSMKKSVVEKLGHADFRDWEKIKDWTEDIAKKIK
ncbi:MAG: flavodoxin domain-containing protein [Anaerolineaceae bacterium]